MHPPSLGGFHLHSINWDCSLSQKSCWRSPKPYLLSFLTGLEIFWHSVLHCCNPDQRVEFIPRVSGMEE